MKSAFKQIRKGTWLAVLGSGSHLLNYLTLIYLVRTLAFNEYAVYGYATSIISILGVVAIFLPDLVSRVLLEVGGSRQMSKVQFRILEKNMLVGLTVLSLILVLFAWYDISPLKGLSVAFVVSMQTVLITAHLSGFYAGILNVEGRHSFVLLSSVALTSGRFVGILLLSFFLKNYTAQQILLIWILAAIICCLVLRRNAVQLLANGHCLPAKLAEWQIWKSIKASLPIALSSALILILANLDMAIVGQKFSNLVISEYSAASALAKIPYYGMQSLFSFFMVELYHRKSQQRRLVILIYGFNALILLGGALYLLAVRYFDTLIYSILLGGRYDGGTDLLLPLTLASLALTLLNFNLLTNALFNNLKLLKVSYVSLLIFILGAVIITIDSEQMANLFATYIGFLALLSTFFVFGNVRSYHLKLEKRR